MRLKPALLIILMALELSTSSGVAFGLDAGATGRALLNLCKSPVPAEAVECADVVSGFAKAILNGSVAAGKCFFQPTRPNDYPEWLRVTIAYLENHPDNAYNETASTNIFKALSETYPCSK